MLHKLINQQQWGGWGWGGGGGQTKKTKYTRTQRQRVRARMQQKRPRSLLLSSFVITCCACDTVGIASVPVCTVCVGTSWVTVGSVPFRVCAVLAPLRRGNTYGKHRHGEHSSVITRSARMCGCTCTCTGTVGIRRIARSIARSAHQAWPALPMAAPRRHLLHLGGGLVDVVRELIELPAL